MTHNRVARKGDRHFCPSHGIAEILAVEEWFKINDAPGICDGDFTGSGARRGNTTDHGGLVIGGRTVPLSAGMAVTTEIKTAKRTVLGYLLAPSQKYKQEALRER